MEKDMRSAEFDGAISQKMEFEKRIGRIHIVRELRDLGISPRLVAQELGVSITAANQYMTGQRKLPDRHIPRLLVTLWIAINTWRVHIKQWRSEPMSDDWKARVDRFAEIAEECDGWAQSYEKTWIRGPELAPDVERQTARADELRQLKEADQETERARRAAVAKASRKKK